MGFVEFVGLKRSPESSVMSRESKIKTKSWWVGELVGWSVPPRPPQGLGFWV